MNLTEKPKVVLPMNNSKDVMPTKLMWIAKANNQEKLKFDVYFGTSENLPLVSKGQEEFSYELSDLEINTTYYWKVVSKDEKGERYESELYKFKTQAWKLDLKLKWKFETGDSIYSSPAIGEDDTIYVGSNDCCVYAINPNGSLKWDYETDDKIYSSVGIGTDGTIYVGNRGGYLYAINSDGTLKWKFKTDGSITSSPAIGEDGTIYIGTLESQ